MEGPQIIVSVSIAVFFCFVGVPVWWQTTRVYRASLPFAELNSLNDSSPIKAKSRWNIFIDEQLIVDRLNGLVGLKDVFDAAARKKLLSYNIESNFFVLEKIKKDFRNLIETFDDSPVKAYDLSSLAEELVEDNHGASAFLQQKILVIRSNNQLNSGAMDCHLVFGATNVIALLSGHDLDGDSFKKCFEKTASEFMDLYPQIDLGLTNAFASENSSKMAPTHSATGVEIAFSLANAKSFDFVIDWDIKTATEEVLEPFLRSLAQFGPYTITSQILNFVDVGILPKKSKKEGYFYSKGKLPLLINPLQSRLTEYTSNNPILNFILYVPPISNMPLKIRHQGKNYRSFLSPRWGGVVVKNFDFNSINTSSYETGKNIYMDVKEDMKLFVLQFRELIGLNFKASKGRTVSAIDRHGVMQWEIDHLLLTETVSNLKKSTSTLISLTELLGKISNIVIRDDIKELIEAAISNINATKAFLENGELKKAFSSSRAAIYNSEKAFYDHSLLALLYFPDDQKYAIYLPLFLPVGIPVLMSFGYAIKSFIHLKKLSKSK